MDSTRGRSGVTVINFYLRPWIVASFAALMAASQAAEMNSAPPVPPVAAKKPYRVPSPNGAREDDYYWLRDDTRQSTEILDYLNKENAYRDAMMASTPAEAL